MDQLLLGCDAASLGQQVKELPHAQGPLQKALNAIKVQIQAPDARIAALTGQPEMAAAARLQR